MVATVLSNALFINRSEMRSLCFKQRSGERFTGRFDVLTEGESYVKHVLSHPVSSFRVNMNILRCAMHTALYEKPKDLPSAEVQD